MRPMTSEIGRTAFMAEMGVDSELEYKKQCIKDNQIMFHAHKLKIPVVMGGILNQKVEDQPLPVDVSADLKKLDFYPCPRLEGRFRKLLESGSDFAGFQQIRILVGF